MKRTHKKTMLLLARCAQSAYSKVTAKNTGPIILDSNKNHVHTGTVVCFGDSLTTGFGTSTDMNFPYLLAESLIMRVVNAGRNGDTTRHALTRLEKDVLIYNPSLVIVEFGGNDILLGIPKEETFKNLAHIVRTLVMEQIDVLLLGVEDSECSHSRGYAGEYLRLARRYHTLCIPNILDGILYNSELMHDHIHPNDKGQKMISSRIMQVLRDNIHLGL